MLYLIMGCVFMLASAGIGTHFAMGLMHWPVEDGKRVENGKYIVNWIGAVLCGVLFTLYAIDTIRIYTALQNVSNN